MADISLDSQNIVIEYCIPVSFNVIKKICSILCVMYGLCILNYYYMGSIYYLHFVRSQGVYFLFFLCSILCIMYGLCISDTFLY